MSAQRERWRAGATQGARARRVVLTFALIFAAGLATMLFAMLVVDRLVASPPITSLVWVVPTFGVLGWSLLHPSPATPTDADQASWSGYAIRWVLIGEHEPRPASVRAVAAVLLGAPVAWSLVVVGVGILGGLF